MKLKKRISTKFFFIVFSGLFASAILSFFFQFVSYRHELKIISENSLSVSQKSFDEILESETQKLSVALNFLIENKTLKKDFIDGNVDKLYEHSIPYFENLKSNFDITHFYYILPEPDKSCFLRVHNKPMRNDKIT